VFWEEEQTKDLNIVVHSMNFKGLYGVMSSPVYADQGKVKKGLDWVDSVNPGGPSSLEYWLPQVLNLAIGLAALVCVAILISSGYMYITSAGDESKVEKASKSLTYAIVGLVICIISVILVQFVLAKVL
jgi:hypothetical protein